MISGWLEDEDVISKQISAAKGPLVSLLHFEESQWRVETLTRDLMSFSNKS